MPDPNAGTIRILQRTQPWVRLASFVGFLLAGLMAAFGADALLGGLSSRRFDTLPFLLLYPLMAIVLAVPAFHLHKCARRIRQFVAQGHHVQLEAALEAQRKFWQFTGILWLVAIIALTLAAGLATIRSRANF